MALRRDFLLKSLTGLAGFGLMPGLARAADKEKLNPEMVRDFVGASHRDLEKVKALYAQEPKLVFGNHDWGNGDFESAIEAAGHVGRRDIADFLIEKGARINFFTLCMLGELEVVQGILTRNPGMLNAKGPHGFTPLHHAIQGDEASAKVRTYLEGLGAKEMKLAL